MEDEYQNQLYKLKLKRFYLQQKIKYNSRWVIVFSLIFIIVPAFNGFQWQHFVVAGCGIAFLWIVFALSNLMDKSFIDRAEHRLRKEVKGYFNSSFRASIAFDATGIRLIEHNPQPAESALAWEQFIGYNDSGNVMLLATTNRKLSWSFTRNEMGEEGYADLRKLVMEKLPTIQRYYEKRKQWWRFVVEGPEGYG